MTWTNKIAGCFGSNDLKFALHEIEQKNAFELLGQLRQAGTGWKEARAEFKAFLVSKKANANHISEQLKKVKASFQPWLRD